MRSFCKTASITIRPCFRMHILKIGIFVGIFTLLKSTPLPSDPDDSDVEILTENENSVIILSDDSDSESQNSVIIIPDDSDMEEDPVDQQPIIIPSDSDSDNPAEILPEDEDNDMDQQPNFLPNGVSGHEIISQTPEEIRIYVAGPPTPQPDELYHRRDPQPSTSTGRRRGPYRGPTLRREFAHLEACMKRRRPAWLDDGIRRNIGK